MNRCFHRGLLLGLAIVAGWAQGQTADQPALTAHELVQGFRDGYVLAKPRADHRASIDEEENQAGIRRWGKFESFGGLRVIEVAQGDTPAAAIQRLLATGRYEFVEPDYLKHIDATPNDPDFTQQWGLNNTGANPTIPGPGIAGADIHAVAAWNTRTDAPSVVVAVVDSGALLTHTDLVANLWLNPQENQDGYTTNDLYGINATVGSTNSASGTPTDTDGHGTHVSGIIGAVGNNGTGVSGVAWKAQLMELKFIGSTGSGSTSAEITCLNFALHHGAALINASFGSSQPSSAEFSALQALQAAGVIFVAAAGNDGEDNNLSPSYPADYLLDNIVTVGCSDNRDDAVYFSAVSSGSVDLFAPGYNIVSLYNNSNTATATLSGTSMSTPFVTGSLALLKAQYPFDTYRQLINRLLRTVDANANFLGRAQTGGRLDLAAALTSAAGANTPFNDAFAARAHLAGPQITVRTSNVGATKDPGEPQIAGNPGGASLWWDWTAPVTGVVTLTTTGSAYPTLVGVYTGTALASLTPVAANVTAGTGASTVSFSAQAGTTYQISTDGQSGATGLTILNLIFANDAFATPVFLNGVSTTLTTSNVNATTQPGEPQILNNAGGHSVWFSWTAPQTGRFQISAYSPDFDPLLAVYTGSALGSLTVVAANAGSAISSTATTPASYATDTFAATAGTTYLIAVDGNVDVNAANEQFATQGGTLVPIGAGQFTLSIADSSWQAGAGDSLSCPPAVGPDGTIYIGCDNSVFYAINPDGSTKWTATAGGAFDTIGAALSLDGTAVYAGASDGNLYAFSTATGAVLWKFPVATSPVACSPAVGADGSIYFKDSGTTLYAVTAAGTQEWTYTVPGIGYAAPSIGPDGTVYLGSDNGDLYAITSLGRSKWSSPFLAGAAIYNAPAIDANGNLYFATLAGTVFAVNSSGNQLWTATLGNSVSASPALSSAGDTVYFGCYDHNVYALSTTNGAVRWTHATGGEIRASSPAVDANGVIYIGSYDKCVSALNPADGTLQRLYATGDWIRSSPVIAGTSLYFGSNDHRLYAFNLGVGSAGSPWPMYMYNAQRYGRAAAAGPAFTSLPRSAAVAAGQPVTFTGAATGAVSYQWYFNGAALAGATGASLTLSNVAVTQAGSYSLAATNASGVSTFSSAATLTVTYNARLINLSVLSEVQGSLTMGFVIGPLPSSASENLLIRAIGPTLAGSPYNVPGVLPDPTFKVVQQSNLATVASNSGWGTPATNVPLVTAADANTGAFALPVSTSKDSALVTKLPAVSGGYSVVVSGQSGDSGNAITEVYDDTVNYASGGPHLINLSCQTTVAAGGTLTAGFVVSGTTSETILVRATGPALAAYGVTGTMPDPQISVQQLPTVVGTYPSAANAAWGGNAQITAADSAASAFPLTNPASKDSALLITVPPGVPYSVQVSSVSGTAGTVLVEIYEVP